jgi:hypothetical protein
MTVYQNTTERNIRRSSVRNHNKNTFLKSIHSSKFKLNIFLNMKYGYTKAKERSRVDGGEDGA